MRFFLINRLSLNAEISEMRRFDTVFDRISRGRAPNPRYDLTFLVIFSNVTRYLTALAFNYLVRKDEGPKAATLLKNLGGDNNFLDL